jgi:hypothetical protein
MMICLFIEGSLDLAYQHLKVADDLLSPAIRFAVSWSFASRDKHIGRPARVTSARNKRLFASRGGLLVKIGVVMMVPMVVMAMYDHHNLALRHVGHYQMEAINDQH